MSKCEIDTKYDRTLLYGLPEIARYMDFSVSTIIRWKQRHAFPISKLPDGAYATSTELVDRWLLARGDIQSGRAL